MLPRLRCYPEHVNYRFIRFKTARLKFVAKKKAKIGQDLTRYRKYRKLAGKVVKPMKRKPRKRR
jgi:hypothetical protein